MSLLHKGKRAQQDSAIATESIRGRIASLYYSSPQFTAGRLITSQGHEISFAGSLQVNKDDAVVLQGHWHRHPKYGRQFKVEWFSFDQKLDPEGLVHYLAKNSNIKGIGPVRARRIVNALGASFEQVLDEHPERIAEIAGLPLEDIQALQSQWQQTRDLNATFTKLAAHGLTHHQMTTLTRKFGAAIVSILETNPYEIIGELDGFSFLRVDEIALKVGIDKQDPMRIQAGIVHCIRERLGYGDCWIEFQNVVDLANKILALDTLDSRAIIEEQLDELINIGKLACIPIGSRFLVALPRMYKMEAELARYTNGAYERKNPFFAGYLVDELIEKVAPEATRGQRDALQAAMTHQQVLISGGAGTGKTTCVRAIVEMYQKLGRKIALAAPTGKAAKRMEEVIGRESATIHRLLQYAEGEFKRGPDKPLEADVIIVDEVSMMDVPLAWHLFRAIPSSSCLVLVGDHNQLPPVGPGNVLRDLIEHQPFPTVILDDVVRQAGVLKESSVAILRGDVQGTSAERSDGRHDWFVLNRHREISQAQDAIVDLFEHRLGDTWGFDVLRDVQLLTPTRKGPLGVDALNIELQRLLQRKVYGVEVEPTPFGRRPKFLVGDKVIQTRNNYDLDVMNGSIGLVREISPNGSMMVSFDSNPVSICSESARDIALAYALTIHKFQGSEVPCAVVVMHKAHSFMHNRNLFYTGVTRAKETAVLVGDHWGMRNCAQREELERRKTFLSLLPELMNFEVSHV